MRPSESLSMIEIPVVGASLRPLPFVILTADLLPNGRITHIDEAEKKAA